MRQARWPGAVTPGRPSLAQTATLDAGLAQQLTVLLLRHTLAALLDHGAHTNLPLETMWLGTVMRSARSGSDLDGAPIWPPREAAAGGGPGTNRTRVPAHPRQAPTGPAVRRSARRRPANTRAPRARARGTTGRPGRRSDRRRAPAGRRSFWKPASERPPRPRSGTVPPRGVPRSGLDPSSLAPILSQARSAATGQASRRGG